MGIMNNNKTDRGKLLYYEIHVFKKKIFAVIRKDLLKDARKAIKFMEKEKWTVKVVFEVDDTSKQKIHINRLFK